MKKKSFAHIMIKENTMSKFGSPNDTFISKNIPQKAKRFLYGSNTVDLFLFSVW